MQALTYPNIDSTVKTSFFGMPTAKTWMLSANYVDKTLMRNTLAYRMARDLGQWAARTHFCEVVLDGDYMGVYVFQEKIKRGEGRVDI